MTDSWLTHPILSLVTRVKSAKYGVFSGPFLPTFGLNTKSLSLRIQAECGKIRTTKNSVSRHFSRSVLKIWISRGRSSNQRYSVIKGVLKNIAKLTGKRLCQRLFLIKLQALRRCFPVNFAIFLETPFLQNISGGLLLQREKNFHEKISNNPSFNFIERHQNYYLKKKKM